MHWFNAPLFRSSILRSCLAIAYALTGLAGLVGAAPPVDFTNETVISGLALPIDIEFLPDGRIIVLEKGGQFWIADPTSIPAVPTAYMLISDVDTAGERGIESIALDPDFPADSYFYVYYTNLSSGRNRISRFEHSGSVGLLGSELVIWQDNEPASSCCHYGGGLGFGPDGNLYLSTGEEFDGNQAQDLTRAGGKLIRIDKTGTPPLDNPFVDGPGGNLDEIFAYGLRNPFRAQWDLVAGRLLIAEVGGNNQAIAHEDIHVGKSGANYGWPLCEGSCSNPDFPLCSCAIHDDPLFTYPHLGVGASITGGIVYRGVQFPAAYQGVYFYGDYAREWVRYLIFDGSGEVVSDNSFDPVIGAVVAFDESPTDGGLYYADIVAGEVGRYVFDGGNLPPVITDASADIMAGPAPLLVNFTGAAFDPESQPLDFLWQFGDGNTDTNPLAPNTYTTNGIYQAYLEVSDPTRSSVSDFIQIEVGIPPNVTITTPAPASLFVAGQLIPYAASGGDPDGSLASGDYQWTIDFIHNTHEHPGPIGVNAPTGDFTVPTSGHDYRDMTGYQLTVVVTDADGLQASDSLEIYPDKVDITLDTIPSTIPLVFDTLPLATPSVVDTLKGFEHAISAPNYCDLQTSTEYLFDSWSNAGTQSQTLVVPNFDMTLTATYVAGGICSCDSRDLTFDGANDWVDIPDLSFAGDFTLEAWVKLDPGISNADAIFGQEGAGQDFNFYNGQLRLFAPGDVLISSSVFGSGIWYHVALVRSGTALSLYVDGALDRSETWTGTLIPKALGRGQAGFLGGMLEEVRLWDDARSASEIALWKDVPLAGSEANLVAYYAFNDLDTLQVVTDWSGNGNHGSRGANFSPGADDPLPGAASAPVDFSSECMTPNLPPMANGDAVIVSELGTLAIPVLANDSDDLGIDPTTVELVSLPSSGNAVVQPDGTIVYTHTGGFVPDSLEYRVADYMGAYSNVASVQITIEALDVCTSSEMIFDGVDDHIELPTLSFPGDFTIEAWVRLEAGIGNADGIVGQNGAGQDVNFFAGLLRLYAPGDVIIATTPTLPDVWTHHAITRSGSDLKLYRNGVLDATGTWTGVFSPSAIGRTNAGFTEGRIDEVRLWSIDRSASIASSYATTVAPDEPGLAAYYRMGEDESDQRVFDITGHGFDGTRGLNDTASSDDPTRVGPPTAPADFSNDCPACLCVDVNADNVIDILDIVRLTRQQAFLDPVLPLAGGCSSFHLAALRLSLAQGNASCP